MLLALVFVLARNVVKLVVERRRGLPFSRFRLKLVAALLGLTIVPSVLVLLVGSELIRKTTERWFSQPVSEVLTSANAIASTYYREREAAVASQAARIAARVPAQALATGDLAALKPAVSAPVTDGRVGMVEIYRVEPVSRRSRRPTSCRSSHSSRRRCRAGTCARRPIGWPRGSRPAAPIRRRTSRSTAAASWCAPAPSRATRAARRSASSSPATSSRAIWRGTRGASPRPTRTTASCAS